MAGACIWNNRLVIMHERIPRFCWFGRGRSPSPSAIHSHPSVLLFHPTYHPPLFNMNRLPTGSGGPSCTRDPYSYGISHTRADNTTNNVHGSSNTNFANISNSYNHTINVGVSEESLRIQEWLSPMEPRARHQDVRNRRLDGVGEWVLQKNEFESWRKGPDSTSNRTLLCYGNQGAGKTYIRYESIFQRP